MVRWGYHIAATLRAWTVSRDEAGNLTLSGSLATIDTYRASQRPLVFTAKGLRWPIVNELQVADGTLSAFLGPKES